MAQAVYRESSGRLAELCFVVSREPCARDVFVMHNAHAPAPHHAVMHGFHVPRFVPAGVQVAVHAFTDWFTAMVVRSSGFALAQPPGTVSQKHWHAFLVSPSD